jgi:hypothetical protein
MATTIIIIIITTTIITIFLALRPTAPHLMARLKSLPSNSEV